ncbi:MAG: HAD family hydrolase [Oscillospiraceae bacterium]|nr:HAD family hydrolase [Oscillospiraceae bacterium]MBQ6697780.1 HAD family hydrolase [Oscillospiraceae bacterium]
MKYTTYLFDFDGTLVDSMPAFVSTMLKILDENNIKYGSDIIKIITPLGYEGTAKYFKERLGIKMPVDEIIALMNRYIYDEYAYNIPAKKNVVETLRKLKEQGANLNVLTASPHSVLDVCLKRLGIFDVFTNVWSCDDFKTTKADPEIYKMAAEKIGKPVGEIIFLDDNYNADKTAAIAGMKVCGVYDKSSEEYTDEIEKISDHYIDDFCQLIELA